MRARAGSRSAWRCMSVGVSWLAQEPQRSVSAAGTACPSSDPDRPRPGPQAPKPATGVPYLDTVDFDYFPRRCLPTCCRNVSCVSSM